MSAENTTKNSGSEMVDKSGETAKLIPTTQKRSWPELVGKSGETAKATIKSERPDLNVIVVDVESEPVVTGEYNPTRVRISVKNGIVVTAPVIG